MDESSDMQTKNDQSPKVNNSGQWRQALPGLVGLGMGAAIVLIFGPNWVTFLGAAALVIFAFVVQKVFGTESWREREEDHAGEQECPECGSLQTDLVEGFNRDGSEYEQMHCFACDADFGEKHPIE